MSRRCNAHRVEQCAHDVFEVGRQEGGLVGVLEAGGQLCERVADLLRYEGQVADRCQQDAHNLWEGLLVDHRRRMHKLKDAACKRAFDQCS